ncbi:undecaprenyldiphospho-muramoylpentapeptide beta-N-acetylglucosaminyltransferase [Thermodesulfovibrio yellowstonii]|uniref:UDP-N-acetylglucosamine--N-acetylmuramyl-(pentapeptide) pyrophosphoryl-undecaprenol N-acetylglucosamine transferase n=1 Tax=Thermodesulfovibrio yellowstonii (strain ATCC 51303 / DSM 11347 / YP87) TaxID=289376 RepID=MURG_THEYD|nr:undecaprenyldiphospho-muramoylpentapeptide beta-N-acetylglucosaminyltransferase [Thermodesulfovibrio yellowstonii]B5YFT4.1 RecName: Full=UDP-N-acetylglucosamine--N-acetylmuramyl-(pentapeptide) pyrophosphoryl-undecaprenol N-acetylglucosamine transferase; AltName: Full=Undecaprenyl-PP-MurNAc-pentapeptide-UDPGlcNAc GlcNAc transferase [Thermodesulfovibrio yellowstonii DSM 11347]ACI20699.1 undecaprenyldiphospho-muramoylpentapeptide beta-N-acetylglucosaminyltransferase [Thermodesulfovibrio yellowsto
MRVIIAGGGTGGHLFPGIALAESLIGKYPEAQIIFVGTPKGLEAKVIPKTGYELSFISIQGFVGKSFSEKAKSLKSLLKSMFESKNIINSFAPDIVFGVGGYASFPVVLAAFLKKIPTIILEQNTVPGLANKLLGKIASAVAITYPETIEYFSREKTYLTGTPIRKKILEGNKEKAKKLFDIEEGRITILILGGSLGARKINKAMTEGLSYLLPLKNRIQIIHQTGEADYNWVYNEYRNLSFRATVLPFIYDMVEAYSVADLVISRAGASTVAELTAIGKASILIPYPYAAYNHQEMNARRLLSRGACELILDRELNGEVLAKKINKILNKPEIMKEMEMASLAFGKPYAGEKIIEIAESLLRRKR